MAEGSLLIRFMRGKSLISFPDDVQGNENFRLPIMKPSTTTHQMEVKMIQFPQLYIFPLSIVWISFNGDDDGAQQTSEKSKNNGKRMNLL